jgi:hypothetical protein
MLGLSAVELGSSVHALGCKRPRINRTPAITRTTAKLERSALEHTSLGLSSLRRAQYSRHLLTAWTWFSVSQLDWETDLQFS